VTVSGQELDEDFVRYRETGDRRVRNRLVERHRQVAEPHVRRYRGRGVEEDDLRQMALLAVLKAVERFDPERGVAFSTFASRTIDGELKRHFRDRAWTVRPPRSIQELHLDVRRAEEEMAQELGRSPRVNELADHLDVTEEDVLEAMEASTAYKAASLDAPNDPDDEDAGSRSRHLGAPDVGFQHKEDAMIVRQLLEGLPDRERTILEMRFFERLTQPEIAERVGVSQSYLSRLLRRVLADLRERERELSEESA